MTTNFQYYPKNNRIPIFLDEVVNVFKEVSIKICKETKSYRSNEVLKECADGFEKLGYKVEGLQLNEEKNTRIQVPVLFGKNNVLEKSFHADAYNENLKSVIEVEAGRGLLNNQFLKDLFQACMMQQVDYLTIAVLNEYRTLNSKKNTLRISKDFDEVCKFFDALYASDRLTLPLKGILIVGYDTPERKIKPKKVVLVKEE